MRKNLFTYVLVLLLAGCASNSPPRTENSVGKTVCDTYLILSMCVQDVSGDDTVDMIYFTDTNEIFMYQEGRRSAVAEFMPFHRCAVPLNEDMQATTNRILKTRPKRGQYPRVNSPSLNRNGTMNSEE